MGYNPWSGTTTLQEKQDALAAQGKSAMQKQYTPSASLGGGMQLPQMPSMSQSQPMGTFPTAQAQGNTRVAGGDPWAASKTSGGGGWTARPWATESAAQKQATAAAQTGQAAGQYAATGQISPEGIALLSDNPELAAWMQQYSDAQALAQRQGVLQQGMDMLGENANDVGLPTSYWNNTAVKAQAAVNAEKRAAIQRLREQFAGRENSAVFQRRLAEIEDAYRNRAVAATTEVEQQRREMNEAAKLNRANAYGQFAGLMPTQGTQWTDYGSYVGGGSPYEQAQLNAKRMSSVLGGVKTAGGGGGNVRSIADLQAAGVQKLGQWQKLPQDIKDWMLQ